MSHDDRDGNRDRSKAAHTLRDLLSFGVYVVLIQETDCVCEVDVRALSSDYVICSAYGDQLARNVSLRVKRTLGARVDLVHVDLGVWLIVTDRQTGGGKLTGVRSLIDLFGLVDR